MTPRHDRDAWVFLAPNLIGFVLFSAGPILGTAVISLLAWDVLSPPRFVGLANYLELGADPLFRQVLVTTILFVLGVVPSGIALSLGLAAALDAPLRGFGLLRGLFFLPVVASSVAVAVVWRWLYNPDFGLINWGLAHVGVWPVPWLSSSDWALPSVILLALWKGLGYDILVFLAGLQAIPRGLYEAADLDGASSWQRFRYVTLPLLIPTTFFVLVVSLVRSFQVFDLAYVLTGGGPAGATNTVVLFVYQAAFHHFRMGYAAAAAWALFLVIALLTLFQSRDARRWVQHD